MVEYEKEFNVTSLGTNRPKKSDFLSGLTTVFEKFAFISKKNKTDIAILAQQKQATQFLSAKSYDAYFKMTDNGYQPTKKQEALWNNIIQKKIDSIDASHTRHFNQDIKTFEYWAEKGIHFTEAHYKSIIFSKLSDGLFEVTEKFVEQQFGYNSSDHNFLKPEHTNLSHINEKNPFIENFLLLTQKDSFCDDLFNEFRHYVKYVKKFRKTLEYGEEGQKELYLFTHMAKKMPNVLLKNISLDSFLITAEIWQKNKEQLPPTWAVLAMDRAIHGVVEGFYRKDIDKKIEITQEIFSESYFKKVATEAGHSIENNFSMKTLPEQAKDLLKSIQEQHSTVKSYKITLSEEDKFTMSNLLEKRIPEVLEKYLSIPPDYRTTLTNNEGKNSQDLMLESLNNFNTKINGIIENYAQNKVQDLSATKRYSKSI